MFFDNIVLAKKARTQLAELPPTPETGWRPPRDYPNISQVIAVGMDFEVKEDEFERGPGWSRGKASISGGSLDLLYPDGSVYTEYRPIRHEVDSHLNCDVVQTIRYWKDVLQSNVPKFGANILYDIGNATDEGIWTQGELYDCCFAEALLSEDDDVNLEAVSSKYLNRHKQTNLLYEWCAKAYGGEPTAKQRSNIYRASPKLVGPYGEQDAHLPRLNIIQQKKELEKQGLWDLFRMECDLIPLLVTMRKIGCRIDLKAAEKMHVRLGAEILRLERKIFDLTGKHLNVNARSELAPAYDAVGIKYPHTADGNPSFVASWFMDQMDPLSELILATRKLYKLKDTFIDSYIFKSHVNGRIHGQFHNLRNEGSRGERGGTTTGRFSSSTPDLQNIPSRTKLGREIMKMFIPEDGHHCWENIDGSQIEYRTFLHFAVGPKADEFRQIYLNDPFTDFHNLAQKTLEDATGIHIPRKALEAAEGNWPTGRMTIKEFQFGNIFGQGLKRLCHDAHCSLEMGKKAQDGYFAAMPFVKPSQKAFTYEAKTKGYITTVLNRRTRFELWEETSEWDEESKSFSRSVAMPYHAAIRAYGSVQRAGTHRALPCRVQGSAADLLKFGFWRCLKDGVYDVIGYPKLTVHDSSGFSVISDTQEQKDAYQYMHWVMENALKLRVPVVYEVGRGPNWGSCD